MAALTDLSDIINRCTGGNSGTPENIFFFKDARVDAAAAAATIAGRLTSLWQYEGNPAGGAAPGGSVLVPDNTTDGGLIQTDPGGSRQKWLLGMTATANTTGTLILYDRLLTRSGLNGTTTTAQSIGGTLTRYTGAEAAGNQIWIEIYTQIGASSTTFTCQYDDQGSSTNVVSTATAIGNTGLREAQRIIPVPLATGDYGVKTLTDVDLTATTSTAGDFGAMIVRPLLSLPITAIGVGNTRNLISELPGPIEIKTDACLALAWLANTTTIPQIFGSIHMIEA